MRRNTPHAKPHHGRAQDRLGAPLDRLTRSGQDLLPRERWRAETERLLLDHVQPIVGHEGRDDLSKRKPIAQTKSIRHRGQLIAKSLDATSTILDADANPGDDPDVLVDRVVVHHPLENIRRAADAEGCLDNVGGHLPQVMVRARTPYLMAFPGKSLRQFDAQGGVVEPDIRDPEYRGQNKTAEDDEFHLAP